MLSKHRSGCVYGSDCLLYLLRSVTMRSKVPLSVCHTLVEYVLSSHATDAPATLIDVEQQDEDGQKQKGQDEEHLKNQKARQILKEKGKDVRYSALDVCQLLHELHGRCLNLLEKYASENNTETSPSTIDAWNDIWKPILISMARCEFSKIEKK